MEKISIKKTSNSRIATLDFTNIPFGKKFSDHMFVADFKEGKWDDMRIVPYNDIKISPATPAIHYGQSIFEGIKAYKGKSSEVLVFRPLDNWKRMNCSADRMCMPRLPKYMFMEGINKLLNLDRDWVPTTSGGSLYIRPFMFSNDKYIGLRPSNNFIFMIITSPAEAYYNTPVKVYIETHYTRAIAGGIGYAKTGGNYGAALYPDKLAQEKGYHQLIWTDGKEHKYIEESGTMNVMFIINDTLVTPMVSDSILRGITRDSVLSLARHWGINVEERKVTVDELIKGLKSGKVTEAFGVGTAATIAHIELIGHDGEDYCLPPIQQRTFSNRVLNELDQLKRGLVSDSWGWIHRV